MRREGNFASQNLVGRAELGSPGKFVVKRVVCQVKELVSEYARALGDSDLLRRIERAMASESETIAKRRATTAARGKPVGA